MTQKDQRTAFEVWYRRDIGLLTGIDGEATIIAYYCWKAWQAAIEQRRGEPVAWLVSGPYQKQAFTMRSSAEAWCRGLNKGFEEVAYSVSELYNSPQPAESVKEPSDAGIEHLWMLHYQEDTLKCALTFASALLANYGSSTKEKI